jgi:hypothetical protein
MRNRRSSPIVFVVVLWVAALIILGVNFFSAGEAGRNATGTLDKSYDFLGMPLLVGFRHADKVGVHLEWGALVLLIAPLVLGLVIVVVQSSRAWGRSPDGATER